MHCKIIVIIIIFIFFFNFLNCDTSRHRTTFLKSRVSKKKNFSEGSNETVQSIWTKKNF